MIDNLYVNKAIEYILDHINEDISVDDVAKYCDFSKYYFSRLFKMTTGESIYAFIKRLKMEQSAFRLKIEKDRSVTDISNEYGYSSSNYSSVFKQHHHKSPAEFRKTIADSSKKHPFSEKGRIELETYDEIDSKIDIEILADMRVIYERYLGNYSELSSNWETFLDKYDKYVNDDTLKIERDFDDPSITDVNVCLYEICITVDKTCDLENTYILKGGKFAIYKFKGQISYIYTAYQSFFANWLPNSDYKIDERYGFEIYRKVDCENMYMEIDICFPIK